MLLRQLLLLCGSLRPSTFSAWKAPFQRRDRRAPQRTAEIYFNFLFTSAGTPATNESGGTSLVTTEPAPVTDLAPTRTGATSIVSDPTLTSSSIIVSCLFLPSKLHVTVPAPMFVRSPIVASPRYVRCIALTPRL